MALRLQGEVSLDGSGFERGLGRLESSASHFIRHLGGFTAGAVGFYGIEQIIHKTVESAEELVNSSRRLDTTIEQLQVMRQAAKDNGAEFSKLESALEKLNIARAKALKGGEEGQQMLAAFAAVGISKKMLQTQTAAQLFMGPLADSVKNKSVETQADELKAILGKGFGPLIPVLKSDFEELGASMKKMGAIMDTETALELKHLKDESALLSQVILSQAAPALVTFARAVAQSIAGLATFASALGAGTAKWNWKDFVKFAINPLLAPEFDRGEAGKAMNATKEQWDKIFATMDARIKAEADRLKHPVAPDYEEDGQQAGKPKKLAAFRHSEDALVRVGNFLGTARGAIGSLDQQKVTLLKQVATNTAPTAKLLAEIRRDLAQSLSRLRERGMSENQFPP